MATLKELMNWTAFAAFTDKKLCPAWWNSSILVAS